MSEEPKAPETGDDGPVTVGLIRQIVKETIGSASSEVNKDTETRQAGRRALNSRLDRDSDIEDRVTAAVEQLKAAEDRQRKDSELQAKVAEIAEKVKDKQPTERNWAHKLMGWGE